MLMMVKGQTELEAAVKYPWVIILIYEIWPTNIQMLNFL